MTATNIGTMASSGTVILTDTLPAGVVISSWGIRGRYNREYEVGSVEAEGEGVTCSGTPGTRNVICRYEAPVPPGGVIEIRIPVELAGAAQATVLNRAEVSEDNGGGASAAVTEGPSTTANSVNGAAAGFGVQDFSVGAYGPAGEPDGQAGSHPATVETTIAYNTVLDTRLLSPYAPVAEPEVVNVDLPMGFVGNALSAPRCTEVALSEEECPADSRIGDIALFKSEGIHDSNVYIYNMVPEAGYPAQFAFILYETVVMLRPRVLPSAGGYVLSVPAPAVPRSEAFKIREVSVLFFGDPSAADGGPVGAAFAQDPVDCGAGPLKARLEMNAWVEPGNWQSAETVMFEAGAGQGVTGCGGLQFDPSVQVSPETTQVDTPSGYEVDLRVPQSPDLEGVLATSLLKNAVVSLPEGVSLSPGAANGLVACQETGSEGIDLGNNDALASENQVQEGEEMGADGLVHPAAGHCPAASQVGEVEVSTPLLEQPLKGHVFVAAPGCGGAGQKECSPAAAEDGELFGIYLEVAGSGVIVKLHGQALVNPTTGRVTTRFTDAPELPFSELKLRLNGGPRAPLANPQSCGTATTASDLTPWSTPFTPDATPLSSFTVMGCTGAFNPGFTAGTVSSAAGAFSPFTLTLSRGVGEGDLSGVSVTMPRGLLGRVAGVVQCPGAAAAAGSCGVVAPGSRVGVVSAAAGSGGAPFWQQGGVFLTGPYRGAPFGLSIVVPAKAGPYNLGNVVVRAAIYIDLNTAVVSVVSDPLPQLVDGVPLRVQKVNVTVGGETPFTFNPTDCAGQAVTGTVTSAQGATAGVSAPFAASGCAGLPFKPVFTASTVGSATKARGASLDTRVVFPAPPAGSGMIGVDANIASFVVELPRQLPSRNSTLQKGCLAAVFDANPALCPSASDVGSVIVHTPVLGVPLQGPVYLVSYGGEKLPQMVMVLQGEGVRIDVTGSIHISKAGITSVTLKTVPDAPFTSFELKTPKGPYSILTSFVPAKDEFNLCGQSLVMPTTITAQNGAVVKQDTKVAITGCPKAKKKAKKAKKAAKKAGKAASGGRGR